MYGFLKQLFEYNRTITHSAVCNHIHSFIKAWFLLAILIRCPFPPVFEFWFSSISVIFYSSLVHSILFYFILFYSVLFCFEIILFFSQGMTLFVNRLNPTIQVMPHFRLKIYHCLKILDPDMNIICSHKHKTMFSMYFFVLRIINFGPAE